MKVFLKRDDLAPAVRARLVRYPAPYESHYGVRPDRPPETGVAIGASRPLYDAANRALGTVDGWAADLPDPWYLSRILPRREAVASSAIEGTQSTLDELLTIEEAGGIENDAALQVRDYASILESLIPDARRSGGAIFTEDLVRRLHRAVMKADSTWRDVPGEFRDQVVYIGGAGGIAYSTFNPPPPDEVPACVAESLDYMRNEGLQSLHQGLITRMAVAHAHFEAVHPFRDGNGRVGRLLLPLMMAADGRAPLYLSPYIEAHRQHYYDALKRAQQQLDWEAIIGFMSSAIVVTVDEMAATRTALARLSSIWRQRRKFRAGSAALRSLDLLPHYPVVTVKRLARLLEVSIPAATDGVRQLEQAGILRERTGYAKNRIYVAHEALTVINRPFGADPVLPG